MKSKHLLIFIFTFSFGLANAQIIKFPDIRFKEAIIASGADANFNREIEVFEAEGVIRLDVSYKEISDLTGIETLKKLQEFVCNDNNISTINLFQNTDLQTLICSNNPLSYLDVSKNLKLQTLIADETLLTSVNLSENELLTKLSISKSKLTSLDISRNIKITHLNCTKNSDLKTIIVFSIPAFINNKKCKKDKEAEWVKAEVKF